MSQTLLALWAAAIGLTHAPEPLVLPIEQTPSGHYAVDIRIQGSEPFAFLVDTGASHTAIAQPMAEKFGFRPARRDPVQTLTDRFDAERFPLDGFTLGPLSLPPLDLVVAPIEPDRSLAAWGLLGADAFPDQVLQVDLGAGELRIHAEPPLHADAVIDPRTDLVFATARVSRIRGPVQVLVDTGATRTIVNPVLAEELDENRVTYRVSVSGISRLNREETDAVILHRFRVGGLCARHMPVLAADLDIFHALGWADQPAMVLGLDMLSSASITVDRQRGVAELGSSAGGPRCGGVRVQRADS